MIIKEQDLNQHLNPLRAKLCLIYGPEPYLLNQAAERIKQVYTENLETDSQIIHFAKPITWQDVILQANSYSLLADQVLIDVRYPDKSFDAAAKKLIIKYLDKPNAKSLILIRAPEVNNKVLTWLEASKDALLINVTKLSPTLLQNWVIKQLKQHDLLFDNKVPALIQQHTQNNMYACAQLIEKLSLVYELKSTITSEFVLKYLDDQSEHPSYELTEACLAADCNKAIQRLRQSQNHQMEPILILWCLTQEIRQLIALHQQIKQHNQTIQQACQALKIWPMRVNNYVASVKRLSFEKLLTLLQTAQLIDQKLKTHQTQQIWVELEQLVMQMC